jgi:transmembrane sensor
VRTDRTKEIEETASDWLIRRDSGHWTAADQARLEQWLDADTLHRVAFLRLELAWEESARLKALGAGIHGDKPPAPGRWNVTPFFESHLAHSASIHRRRRLLAVAATILLTVATGSIAYHLWRSNGDRYTTPVGGLASVPMPDGSRITLNTNSQVRVALTKTERHVDLKHGEAFFEVAKDPKRPFIVEAGTKRVIAVGTKFSVRVIAAKAGTPNIEVVVTEGKVRIEDVFLTPGTIARADEEGVLVQRKALPEAETHLSWRTGVLMFRDETLADAVAEFNRYNMRKIIITDPAVAGLKIEGNFRANNVEAFVRLLESGFPVRATAEEDQIVLRGRDF